MASQRSSKPCLSSAIHLRRRRRGSSCSSGPKPPVNTEKDLDDLNNQFEGLFGSKLIYSKRVFYQAEQGFNSTMPLGNDELMITFNMNTSPIASGTIAPSATNRFRYPNTSPL